MNSERSYILELIDRGLEELSTDLEGRIECLREEILNGDC